MSVNKFLDSGVRKAYKCKRVVLPGAQMGRFGKNWEKNMNAVVDKVASLGATVKPLNVLIVGKVTRVRRYEQFTYTTIICPAKDEYTKPSIVEVRSKARFAEREETTRVTCELGGYEAKPYQITDKESGERKTLIPVNLYLDLVE